MTESELLTRLERLERVKDFQRKNKRLFRTEDALRHILVNRETNGLLSSGAVVEGRTAMFIDPPLFLAWYFNQDVSKAA